MRIRSLFRSLFGRLMASYLVIVLFTLAIGTGAFAYLVRQYVYESREAQLKLRGQEIADLVQDMLNRGQDFQRIMEVVRVVAPVSGATWVTLVGHDGVFSGGIRVRPEDLAVVNAGRQLVVLGSQYGSDALTVLVPVFGRGGVVGAVLLQTPTSELREAAAQMTRLLLIPALIAIGLSMLVGHRMSVSISRPMREMASAALAMARGDFSRRVKVPSEDEVGKLARTINLAAEELDKLEKLRREFIANVSHELRSPLARLLGSTEALLDGVIAGKEEVDAQLELSRDEILRLGRLVDDLLFLSQAQAGFVRLNREALDLGAVAARVVRKAGAEARSRGVALESRLEPDLPPVWADPDRIEQVLTNLVDNALKFTPSGGSVSISGSISKSESSGVGFVQVNVADTGMGIPDEEIPLVWERFHKVDRSRTPGQPGRTPGQYGRSSGQPGDPGRGSGTGLGLAIVKQIVELHGGNVGVDSSPGAGSSFYFTLPILAKAGAKSSAALRS
ncbi:MAG: cell wall metabolism sensor histidine kinase WalK [Actinobacteria bacterium]|nr:cell wall metabolism sensor histidine kinase WalK [Actinomycetota bacterium]